jgi:hypothetical protein
MGSMMGGGNVTMQGLNAGKQAFQAFDKTTSATSGYQGAINTSIAMSNPFLKKIADPIRHDKFTKTTLSNVKATAYSIKSAANQMETNLSKKANYVRITFIVDENSNAKAEEKTYYIQIINSRNNVIGKRITEFFDNGTLTYSLSKTINYTNQAINCSVDVAYDNFESGIYYVTIFDRNELVGKSFFTLK